MGFTGVFRWDYLIKAGVFWECLNPGSGHSTLVTGSISKGLSTKVH